MVLFLTPHLAASWWSLVCAAWWDAWEEIWEDVSEEKQPKRIVNDEDPDVVDTHVDFGGGDE